MRRKKLLTAALCTAIALASPAVSGRFTDITGGVPGGGTVVWAEESNGTDGGSTQQTQPATPAAETPPTQPATPAAETPPTQPTTPAAETPTTPATEAQTQPTTPATEPTTPATEPTTPATEPTTPATEPTTPATEPATQVTEPATPATEPSTSTETATESETLPSETVPDTEGTTEGSTESEQQSETPGETATEKESETEKETEKETESEEEESETSQYGSNAELIAHQNIVVPPDISLEFRFTQVEARYALVSNREGAQVYEEKSTDARAVGALEYYGICCILEDSGDGWYYVESGNVRGFMEADQLVTDEVAERIVRVKGLEELSSARLLVARTENEAFDYTHTTVQEVIAQKQYAVASGEVKIYDQKKESSNVTGILSDGSLCYILADGEEEWVFVESGSARGFVRKSSLTTGAAASAAVSGTGENNMSLAQVLIAPENNRACYYTVTSVKAASQAAMTREAIVNFALQFIGNPYVWGGTSLTGGADCSGFVQSVYANFGYSLPRVAEAQAGYGMQIPVSSAEPGDLIFYARNGYVYHVSMYIGNGRVIHAANERVGIITSGIGGDAVWATRIISD